MLLTRNLCHTTFITAYNPQQASTAHGLHGICDDVVHLQHDIDQSYMGCRQLPVFYW